MLKEQIGQNIEVYEDDIIVKSIEADDHLIDKKETFDRLRQYNMKLNPQKCTFKASSRKFLGFIVTRGISRKILKNPSSP